MFDFGPEKLPPGLSRNGPHVTVLGYDHTKPNRFCAGTKTIRNRASVHTHKNRDFGAIPVTERSCTALISKVKSRLSDRCSQ